MRLSSSAAIIIASSFIVSGCKQPDLGVLSASAANIVSKVSAEVTGPTDVDKITPLEIGDVVEKSSAKIKMDGDIKAIVRSAVLSDPLVIGAQANYKARSANVNISKSLKDFQFSGTIYGGIEDVTDETAGVAAVLNANKMIYDGGRLDSLISADEYYAVAALGEYELMLEESALVALRAWVELDRYNSLNNLISSRLDVLGPLISQLEQVAEAGLGDAAMVSAAQRTVSMIQVTQTDVEQRLAQAEVSFLNVFGSLPTSMHFNGLALSAVVPAVVSKDLIVGSPALRVEYANYQAALAALRSVKATDSINLGFQSKIQRPFGESEYDSDESLGLVLTKTLYNGGKLKSEIELAQAEVNAQLESFKSTFRFGERAIKTSQETISAMEKAIDLAKDNAINTRDEINYLRKQLIIGQSTLDSVLSAEARLYEAEAKEIDFIAERHLAELTILSSIGLLSGFLSIDKNL